MATPTPLLHLEQYRRRKGVSLEHIAQSTKISTHFLRAIESEEFEKLPGGVFNTSYLRQYAGAIGYEADELLQHYWSRQSAQAEQEQGSAEQPRVRNWSLRSAIEWLRSPSPEPRY